MRRLKSTGPSQDRTLLKPVSAPQWPASMTLDKFIVFLRPSAYLQNVEASLEGFMSIKWGDFYCRLTSCPKLNSLKHHKLLSPGFCGSGVQDNMPGCRVQVPNDQTQGVAWRCPLV